MRYLYLTLACVNLIYGYSKSMDSHCTMSPAIAVSTQTSQGYAFLTVGELFDGKVQALSYLLQNSLDPQGIVKQALEAYSTYLDDIKQDKLISFYAILLPFIPDKAELFKQLFDQQKMLEFKKELLKAGFSDLLTHIKEDDLYYVNLEQTGEGKRGKTEFGSFFFSYKLDPSRAERLLISTNSKLEKVQQIINLIALDFLAGASQ
jgi:hypothetical protein